MSWYFTVPPTPKDQFDAAVDAAQADGQDAGLPGVADDIAAAKAALKSLALRVKRPLVFASANGHSLQSDEGAQFADTINVTVNGAGEVAPAAPAPDVVS